MSSSRKPLRVLVADALSDAGVDRLRAAELDVTVKTGMKPDELASLIGDFHALIVRSATKVTPDVLAKPGALRVIGRAGTGVDNIDLDAATRAGVVVMNTPGGNSVAAAELTMSLLLSLARNVPQANHDLREGRWERKRYLGDEVDGKTLGVVGLGRIGREVARRARGFRMKLVGYDPFVSSAVAGDLGVEVAELDDLLAHSDFVTLHLPRSAETHHLINAERIARMKPGARLINCARGGLVDEKALHAALESGHLAGAALDVFEKEPPGESPLVRHPSVVSTPHLGASTREAQVRVGVEIADKVADFLKSGVILDAVNFPSIGREEFAEVGPLMTLAERMGCFLSQIVDGGFRKLEVRALGSFAKHSLRPIAMAAAKGLLAPVTEGGVSYVNALSLARDRGIDVEESRSSEPSAYAGLLRLRLRTDAAESVVAGTLVGNGRARVVEIDGVAIEAEPSGNLLFLKNEDRPGVVGKIGTILGEAGVNIAGIHLGRSDGAALSILNVDAAVPEDAARKIRDIPEILTARPLRV